MTHARARQALHKTIIAVVFSLCSTAASAQLFGPPQLKDPADAQSSMVVLQIMARYSTFIGNRDWAAQDVTIGLVGADGKIEKEIKQTGKYGLYVFFENLQPGKYQLIKGTYVAQSGGGPTTTTKSGNITTTTTIGTSSGTPLIFEPALIAENTVELPAGSVLFLGDYIAQMQTKMSFPLPIQVMVKGTATRTKEGADKATAMMKEEYPKSGWNQRPMTLGVAAAPAAPAPAAEPAPAEPKKE